MPMTLLLAWILSSMSPTPQNAANRDVFVSEIWNAWNVTPRDQLRQMNWPIALHLGVPTTFLIYTDGKTFSGLAIVDTYPGYGELRDGKIFGNKVSFTVIAHPIVNGQRVDHTIYYTGTITGNEMDLVMDYSPKNGQLNVMMKAKKFEHE